MIWDPAFKTPEVASEAENPLEHAKWIWHREGNPAVERAGREAILSPKLRRGRRRRNIESARVFMTADNSFELWVNGRKAGKGDNFHVASAFDVKRLLRAGTNVLAVAAENGGDCAESRRPDRDAGREVP